ncbi:TerB family tellurite resistance protein [Roseateles amylovorans]|uniref:TerB family tellurite resistance protein n=1 Tax=Roseateles amylovorans TaxID=2978473 RepID=A0ABY6B598_9BURK|nr:TerB family tellurite resistance protein [Roseateles amylovorans]UXH78723.1 TerB family tellurite resistance protein [Roseateles amylovorans]
MLKTLKDLFDGLLSPLAITQTQGCDDEHALQLATAVLLVEVMRADATFADDERAAVRHALGEKFALSGDEADRLTELAETAAREATDLFAFTSRVDSCWDMPAKLRMIELMWGVAYADGRLTDHERHVMWRLADLLHVPQGAYVHARLRAKQAAGLGDESP